MAARKVSVYVHAHIRDEDGNIVDTVVLKPGDTAPGGAALGEQCFEKADMADEKPATKKS